MRRQTRRNAKNMAGQISFKPLIARRQQRDDGTYNVKIRVTYKRVSRFLSTTITAPRKDIDKDGNLKGESLNRGYAVIQKLQRYLNDLDLFLVEDMDVDDVIKYLRRKSAGPGKFKLDFFQFAENEVLPSKSPGTAGTYVSALNSFRRYLGKDTLDINEITRIMLMDFASHIDKEPKVIAVRNKEPMLSKVLKRKGFSSAIYLGKLRTIFKAAVDRFNDEEGGVINIPRNPFSGVDVTVHAHIAHTAQESELIQKLIDYPSECKAHIRFAIDVYLISFALMGMNTKDLFEALPAKKGVIIYNRAKTRNRRQDHAEHRVQIDARIIPLLDKYKDPTGERLFNFHLYYKSATAVNHSLRYSLNVLATALGVESFTINSARHTWATIARRSRCGVDPATVDECLVHVGEHKLVDVYAEKDWKVYWDVNKKVLDLFDWSSISGGK